LYFWQLAGLRPAGGDHPGLLPLIALGAWGASTQKVPIRDRKISFAVNLVGIPLLVAIPFLPPAGALSSVFCGLFIAQLRKRKRYERVLVSCLVCSVAMGLGILVYDHGLGRGSPTSALGWLVGAAALTTAVVFNLTALLAAVAVCTWRWHFPPLRETVVHALMDLVICFVGGITAIILVRVGIWDVALFGVVVAAGDVGWRRAARAAQRHAALDRLYKFTESLALAQGGERELVTTVLEGARALLSASRAALVVPLAAPLEELTLRCTLSGEGPVNIDEAVPRGELARLVAERGPLVIARGSGNEDKLAAAHEGFGEAVIAPLRPGDPATGYLLVAERAFSHEGFGPGDVQVLEALAANAAVALRKGGLLDKLRHEAAVREYEAHHDPLTGLPNRALFFQRLEGALKLADEKAPVAVVLLDLDGFKQVNDTLGHESGDAVLTEVAKRLGPMADATTLVARIGGDEFVVLVEEAGNEEQCVAKADLVLAALAAPMEVEGLDLIVRASVGVAAANAKVGPGALVRQADMAMYKAKAHGGGVRVYEPEDDRSDVRRLTMAAELRKAIEANSLELNYQVVVDLRSGRVIGCEALSRWSHEQFGAVPPDQFILVAEKAGLIDPLTSWVLDTSLRQVNAWRQISPGLSISVNLSAVSLLKHGLARRVGEALDRAGLEPSALRLELTETTMMAEMGKKALAEISELGVALSIDDFGTGYSSLSRLRGLPFDEVKIDRSFVSQMCRASDDQAVVRSVIELARGLGKVATAEGVEDRATLERLTALGCHGAQGYYLARPLPASECEAVLRATPLGPRVTAGPGPAPF
jgi:diguanylate cyclase (GGDEF)-like protein